VPDGAKIASVALAAVAFVVLQMYVIDVPTGTTKGPVPPFAVKVTVGSVGFKTLIDTVAGAEVPPGPVATYVIT
jgi:ABC-type Co2+ transport system permease subunit